MGRILHVSPLGDDRGNGTEEHPYRTISTAAGLAQPGDRVVVHGGVYREWVDPCWGGESDENRIVYEAAPGEKAVIKGSEIVRGWAPCGNGVWSASVSNTMFGACNPYLERVEGDWFMYPDTHPVHTGCVCLNGETLREAGTLGEVYAPEIRTSGYKPPWNIFEEEIPQSQRTAACWYVQVNEESTEFFVNFAGLDPNEETVEIFVRRHCFYPSRTGVDYITVRGFEMAHAACGWAPPTAEQAALMGPHWSKGWIIENNHIHGARCAGISIGKEIATGENEASRTHVKPGYQTQIETVFRALESGWCRERIGSHIIRNNVIHDCGQAAIVGNLGGAFSRISGNHIYNIGIRHEFFGYEIAGIKLHAAIDTQICRNRIHGCTLGLWLDWQAQGACVSKNLFYGNDRDMMVEVTHGPYLVEHNVFASRYNFDIVAQGGAYVNNLCLGMMRRAAARNRATPYHLPHSTKVAGVAPVYGGDDRFFNNLFVRHPQCPENSCGTALYNGSTKSLEEYIGTVRAAGHGDVELYEQVEQPVSMDGNVYLAGARAFEGEARCIVSQTDPQAFVEECGDGVYLELTADEEWLQQKNGPADTSSLGRVRIAGAVFDTPHGGRCRLDTDYTETRWSCAPAGPFSSLVPGRNRILIWKNGTPDATKDKRMVISDE